MARPPAQEPLDHVFQLRISKRLHGEIEAAALQDSRPVAAWIRLKLEQAAQAELGKRAKK